MRLPTFGKPRVIACVELLSRHVALPRGCLEGCNGAAEPRVCRDCVAAIRAPYIGLVSRFCLLTAMPEPAAGTRFFREPSSHHFRNGLSQILNVPLHLVAGSQNDSSGWEDRRRWRVGLGRRGISCFQIDRVQQIFEVLLNLNCIIFYHIIETGF